jgi:protein-S-isoprenylcysteine O-methyltransferase Ste14
LITIGAVVLLALGLALRWLALRQNKNFTWHSFATVPKNLVTTGVYKYIRHPGYLGSMLIVVGLSLISLHLALWLLVWSFLMDNAMDEEIIIEQSGFPYDEYKASTGMFIPKLIGRPRKLKMRPGGLHPQDEVM